MFRFSHYLRLIEKQRRVNRYPFSEGKNGQYRLLVFVRIKLHLLLMRPNRYNFKISVLFIGCNMNVINNCKKAVSSSKSFKYIKKNKGARTDPWGTLVVIKDQSKLFPFKTTIIFQSIPASLIDQTKTRSLDNSKQLTFECSSKTL